MRRLHRPTLKSIGIFSQRGLCGNAVSTATSELERYKMARRKYAQTTLALPTEPDASRMPRRVTSPQGAQIVAYYYGPISARTIRERWGLTWREFNGKATVATRDLLAKAQEKFDEAPEIAA